MGSLCEWEKYSGNTATSINNKTLLLTISYKSQVASASMGGWGLKSNHVRREENCNKAVCEEDCLR